MKIERHWITSSLLGLSARETTKEDMEKARERAILELFRDVIYKTRSGPRVNVKSIRIDPIGERGTVGVFLAPCSNDF